MVRADMLDNIDVFLRVNRKVDEPFGGVQMLFFGDLFQLPPVIGTDFEKQYLAERYESPYFFSADILHKTDMEMVELTTVFRQDDRRFIRMLDNIRTNEIDWDDLEEINERHTEELPLDEDLYIVLSGRNQQVEQLNEKKLNELETPAFEYPARVEGQFPSKLAPTAPLLRLKKGAQVMFLKNDAEKEFVNGTLGIISHLDHDQVKVRIREGNEPEKEIEVKPMDWESIQYDIDEKRPGEIKSTVLGTFRQYPLKLAWAITIHKSQGKTFHRVMLDLGRQGAFEFGQSYVALSRCTSLDGLILKRRIQARDIMVDQRIVEFMENRKRFY